MKAYENEDFLGSPDGRAVRLMSEYLEPRARLQDERVNDTIVFFGSARLHDDDATHPEMRRYYRETRELARRFTEWSIQLDEDRYSFVVCSGGGPGIMEATNRGAADVKGGTSVGLGISLKTSTEKLNSFVPPELAFEFHYFALRKFWFLYLAKAIIVMPGGFGTLDELAETMTLQQTHKIKKPMCTVLYGPEYWDKVLDMDVMKKYGTIGPDDIDRIHFSDSVDDTFNYVTNFLKEHYIDRPRKLRTTTESDIKL